MEVTTNTSGQNARIVLNDTIVEKTTNDFTVNGMRFNLKETMEAGQIAHFKLENNPDVRLKVLRNT